MALPSGYTQIDYIEATGTQYINTYFTPNGNSRIVMDCEPTDLSKTFCFFCSRTKADAGDTTSNTAFYISGEYRKDFYGESQSTLGTYAAGTRFTLDSNRNTVDFGADYTLTFTASSNASPMPLILMASATSGDTAGTVNSFANYAKMKLYSCKIYDNGTLVRDFVPCKADGGEIGLFDLVESVFYGNSGTGTLTTGNKHKTLIGGTGYEIKSGRVLIGGTGYDIKSGRTLIDGTGYGISFSTPAGDLAIGSSVYMNIDGARTEFIIVQQGKPDASVYDDTCNGTWLLAKNIYSLRQPGGGCSVWKNAKVQDYLNGDFLSLFDSWVQSLIKTVNFPKGHIPTDTDTMSYKITVVHPNEMQANANTRLTQLDIFKNSSFSWEALYNGSPQQYYLRSAYMSTSTYYYELCTSSGAIASVSYNYVGKAGLRPLLVIPQDALVSGSLDLIQS